MCLAHEQYFSREQEQKMNNEILLDAETALE